MLLLAESGAGHILRHVEVLRFDRLIEASGEMFRGVAEERGVVFEVSIAGPMEVAGDSTRLRQVVNNLIDNAIKYTEPGRSVHVEGLLNEFGRPTFRVADHGCGISKHDLSHVFERFYRGDKSREREGRRRGTGLGLAIAHAIVQAHRGTIEVESELGYGTKFTVTLPVATAPDSALGELPQQVA
ncbi:MAG: HAMP domain-containing sensor histidine kinase [Pirellulales bacterium]